MISSFLKEEYGRCRELLNRVPPLLFALLVLSTVSMNLLANKELLRTDWIALDCGFTLSWIPFLIMDAICRAYGGRDAARLSIISILINLTTFGIFKLTSLTPGMWGEYYSTGLAEVNRALNRTIGGSSWIVMGSAIAMAVASAVNSAVNVFVARFTKKDNYAAFAARSFTSTAVSQFSDNLVFSLIVSIPLFGWNIRQALVCSAAAAMFELVMEILFSGAGYRLSLSMRGRTDCPHRSDRSISPGGKDTPDSAV